MANHKGNHMGQKRCINTAPQQTGPEATNCMTVNKWWGFVHTELPNPKTTGVVLERDPF